MNSLTSPSFWTHKMISYYWIIMDYYWIIYIFFQNFLNSDSSLICCTAVVLELLFSNFPILSPHFTLILFPKSCDFLFIDLIPPHLFLWYPNSTSFLKKSAKKLSFWVLTCLKLSLFCPLFLECCFGWCRILKWKLLSRVQLFATPWTVAHQAPLSMGFSRQEYWSG